MIKIFSNPKNTEVYGDYNGLVNVLLAISIIGSCISGFTEWYGFKSDAMAEHFPVLYPVFGVALIESSRFIIPLLFLTLSRIIKQPEQWKSRVLPLFILLVVSIALTYISKEKSKDGITYRVEKEYEFTEEMKIDSTKYHLLTQNCEYAYKAEQKAIDTDVKNEYGKEIEEHKQKARRANQRVSELAHSDAKWAVATVAKMVNISKGSTKVLTSLEKEIESKINDKYDVAESNYNECLKAAQDTLFHYMNIAEAKHNQLIVENDSTIDRKTFINNWIMYIGIFFIWLYSATKEWLNHVSKKERNYTFDDSDNDLGFTQRIFAVVKQYIHLYSNDILVALSSSLTQRQQQDIIKQQEKKQQEKLQQQRQQQEALRREQERTKEAEEINIETARLKAERIKIEADATIAKAKAEAVRIEADNKQQLAATTTRLETERLERKARLQREHEERELQRQQERERLEEQQQEVERERQQLIREQQEMEQRQQLLLKAKEVKAAQQQVKDELTTTLSDIKTTSTTGEVTDYQLFVNSLIDKSTKDGVLILNSKFTTVVKQWHSRNIESAVMLSGTLTDKKRNQITKAVVRRQQKLDAMIETLKHKNINCYVDEENVIQFEPSV
jgi:hypothetical protein